MRRTPVALAIAMLFAVSSSTLLAQGSQPDPRAAALLAEGRSYLAAGDTQTAIDAFEAALAIDPSASEPFIELGNAARQEGLQGKAIRYYRLALERDPQNLAAIAGEGAALAEKGALDSARENLARLEDMCGASCPEARSLASVIARGPVARMITAEAVLPDSGVSAN